MARHRNRASLTCHDGATSAKVYTPTCKSRCRRVRLSFRSFGKRLPIANRSPAPSTSSPFQGKAQGQRATVAFESVQQASRCHCFATKQTESFPADYKPKVSRPSPKSNLRSVRMITRTQKDHESRLKDSAEYPGGACVVRNRSTGRRREGQAGMNEIQFLSTQALGILCMGRFFSQ